MEEKRIKRRPRRRTIKRKNRISDTMVLVSSIIFIVLVILFVKERFKINKLKKSYQEVIYQQEELKKKIDVLKQEIENSSKLEYIEKKAREDLGMIKPGEKIYLGDTNKENKNSEDSSKKEGESNSEDSSKKEEETNSDDASNREEENNSEDNEDNLNQDNEDNQENDLNEDSE